MLPDVTFLGHASVLIELNGIRIVTDPLLFSRVTFLGRVGPTLTPRAYADVDVVLISHLHHDHCDVRSLRLLRRATVLVPRGGGNYLRRRGITKVIEVPVGSAWNYQGVRFRATPALHDGHRVLGPDAEAIGFLIETPESRTYFAGDTDVFDHMKDLGDGGQLDLALLPVWGWGPNLGPGHMDPERAVDALHLLRPLRAMPIHWGTLFPYGLKTVRPALGDLLESPPRHFVELAKNRGTPAEVLVVEPGQLAEFSA